MDICLAPTGPAPRQADPRPAPRRPLTAVCLRLRAGCERARALVSYSSADDAGTTRHWS